MRKKYKKVIKDDCNEAIIFARVSSEKQEKGASIDAQKNTIYDYCKLKDLKVIKEFTITESTIRGDRKQYHEMLNFIEKRNKKTAIVVNCVDRLQRSDRDNPILDDMRREGKIEVHFLKENMILKKDSLGSELLFWKMHVLMANSYVISLSSNVKRSMNYNRSQGLCQGYAPAGYINKKEDEKNTNLILDEVRAPIVKRLYEEYATGSHTLKTIWLLAKQLGLYSRLKKRKGLFVSKNTVYDILTNPFYYGEMCVNGEFMPHIHPPLISKDLYDRVQKLFVENGNRNRTNVEEYAKMPYIFRGFVHCKKCGGLITPEKKTKKNGLEYVYLRCAHICKDCSQKIVNEKIILEQLKKEVFDKISIPANLQELLTQKLLKDLSDTSRFNATLKTNITNEISELKVKESNLLDFYLEGKLKQEVYEMKQAAIEKQIKELEARAEKYKTIDSNMKSNITKIMSMASNISHIFEKASISRKNELIKLLITDCKLNGKVLEYKIRAPFDKLVQCNHQQWSSIAVNHLDEFEMVMV